VGTIMSALRQAAVPGLARGRSVGPHHPAARNMVAVAAGTRAAAAGTVVAAAGTRAVAIRLRRFPVTRVDAAAVAARATQPRSE
jgi:hypothetical protein